MKKTVALLALLVLIVAAAPAWAEKYSGPVEAIESPVHLQYGPGSQRVSYAMDMKAGGQTMKMAFDTLIDVRKDGDNLVSDVEVKNMKVKAGGKKNVIDGSFIAGRFEMEPSGKVLSRKFSSKVLNKQQVQEMQNSLSTFNVLELVEQDAVTGTVLFSGRNALAQELAKQGLSAENLDLEYVLSGYVMHEGEKALLVECNHPDAKLKQVSSGTVVNFGLGSYMILRADNLQYIHSETTMEISVPGSSEVVVMEMVMSEE